MITVIIASVLIGGVLLGILRSERSKQNEAQMKATDEWCNAADTIDHYVQAYRAKRPIEDDPAYQALLRNEKEKKIVFLRLHPHMKEC